MTTATHLDTKRCGIVIRRRWPPLFPPPPKHPPKLPTAAGRATPRVDQAILEATIELLAEVGYDRTSIDAVAARAGVSKPTIYRRWPEGKEQLVSVAVAQCKEDEPLIDTGSLRGDLVASIEHMIAGMRENAQLAAGLTQRLRESPQLAQVFRDQIVSAKRERFRTMLQRAADRGELAACPTSTHFSRTWPRRSSTRAR